MKAINCIMFDCMETIVDIIEKPDLRLYAWWAYNGCGFEHLWESFNSFADAYNQARINLDKTIEPNEEYSLFERFGLMTSFMVKYGIEELLEIHGIRQYFDFVVTSINVGWRKPSFKIYNAALHLANVPKEQVLFVGDDYICDYESTKKYGFNPAFLDRDNTNQLAEFKIRSIPEVLDFIQRK